MKISDIQTIVNKRDRYTGLARTLQQVRGIGEHAHLVCSGTIYLTGDRARAVRDALVAVIQKELEPVKAELMMLGVTEFD